jgi:predicted RNase H-like HicB family nuclease
MAGLAPEGQRECTHAVARQVAGIQAVDRRRDVMVDRSEAERDPQIAVEAVDDGYVATFTEAGIAMAGDTIEDAMSDLKSWLVDVFEHLTEMPTERLGPDLIRKREVLRTYMRRVE